MENRCRKAQELNYIHKNNNTFELKLKIYKIKSKKWKIQQLDKDVNRWEKINNK